MASRPCAGRAAASVMCRRAGGSSRGCRCATRCWWVRDAAGVLPPSASAPCSKSSRICARGCRPRRGSSRAGSSRCSRSAARSWARPRYSCSTSRRSAWRRCWSTSFWHGRARSPPRVSACCWRSRVSLGRSGLHRASMRWRRAGLSPRAPPRSCAAVPSWNGRSSARTLRYPRKVRIPSRRHNDESPQSRHRPRRPQLQPRHRSATQCAMALHLGSGRCRPRRQGARGHRGADPPGAREPQGDPRRRRHGARGRGEDDHLPDRRGGPGRHAQDPCPAAGRASAGLHAGHRAPPCPAGLPGRNRGNRREDLTTIGGTGGDRDTMPTVPSWTSLALLLGLSFFFGLAFEEFYRKIGEERPGGIRTFPLLAIGGGALYLLDTQRLLPFTAGLLVLGAWLFAFYHERVRVREKDAEPNAGLMVPLCNVQAYLLGAVALAFPAWMAVGVTVASVLFFTGRE